MRKIFLSSLLLINMAAFCQTEDSTIDVARKKQIDDSITAVLNSISNGKDYTSLSQDPDNVQEGVNPGLDYFVRMQEREKAEKKKTAVLRIVLGVLLLGILIIGLTRKVKKQESRSQVQSLSPY
jgi:hypothetical protein